MISKSSTLMYRAPELIDQYQSDYVDQGSDVWALGCLMYLLASCKHPFAEAQNLSILNQDYHMNDLDELDERLQDLIRACLLPNNERIGLKQMIEVLEGTKEVEMSPNLLSVQQKHAKMLERH